jgi:hypothetical protein
MSGGLCSQCMNVFKVNLSLDGQSWGDRQSKQCKLFIRETLHIHSCHLNSSHAVDLLLSKGVMFCGIKSCPKRVAALVNLSGQSLESHELHAFL